MAILHISRKLLDFYFIIYLLCMLLVFEIFLWPCHFLHIFNSLSGQDGNSNQQINLRPVKSVHCNNVGGEVAIFSTNPTKCLS